MYDTYEGMPEPTEEDKGRYGETAIARLKTDSPGIDAELILLDLASLASMREAAEKELAKHRPLAGNRRFGIGM